MKIYLKVALIVVMLVFLGIYLRATDWTEVAHSIQQVGYNFLFLLFVTFVSAWLGVLGWRYCLPHAGKGISGWQLFWIRMIGENVAILNPTSVIGGEAMKIYMLRDLGIQQRAALNSIVLSRAIMILSQICMLLIAGIGFLYISGIPVSFGRIDWLSVLFAIAVATLLIVLLRSLFFKNKLRNLLHRMGWLERVANARRFVLELVQELRVFYRDNRRAMLFSFLLCCLHWIVGSMEFYFILLFLGIKTTIAKALLVDMGVVLFKTAGGFIPAQVGIEEYGNKIMLGIIGIASGTVWLTVSILRRSRQLFWILFGFVVYLLFFRGKTVT